MELREDHMDCTVIKGMSWLLYSLRIGLGHTKSIYKQRANETPLSRSRTQIIVIKHKNVCMCTRVPPKKEKKHCTTHMNQSILLLC